MYICCSCFKHYLNVLKLLILYYIYIVGFTCEEKYTDIPPCSLEIDHMGIRLVDHAQENEVD